MKITEIVITQSMDDDGQLKYAWTVEGNNEVSNVVGLLEMTKLNVSLRMMLDGS